MIASREASQALQHSMWLVHTEVLCSLPCPLAGESIQFASPQMVAWTELTGWHMAAVKGARSVVSLDHSCQ